MNELFSFLNHWGIWGWLTFGLILMILELIIPGTFIIWFGFGAVITGIVVALIPLSASGQVATFAICSTVSVFFGFFIYKKIFGANKEVGQQNKTGARKYIGQTFKVVETIDEDGEGKVAVGDTVWLAKSDHPIAQGRRAKVVDVKGTILIVE